MNGKSLSVYHMFIQFGFIDVLIKSGRIFVLKTSIRIWKKYIDDKFIVEKQELQAKAHYM